LGPARVQDESCDSAPPYAQVAQSVEQRIENPRVGGSIPSLGTSLTSQVHDVVKEASLGGRVYQLNRVENFIPGYPSGKGLDC
jgi:hypothetical protein